MKEYLYYKTESADCFFSELPTLKDAISFYQLGAPLGIIGNTILDDIKSRNSIFRVKHSFFVHTLEDEILLELLLAMKEQRQVELQIKSTKNGTTSTNTGVPLKIFTSTRTGRRFVCYYEPDYKRFTTARLDSVISVKTLNIYERYSEIRVKLDNNLPSVWGVSFNSPDNNRMEHVKLTLRIDEQRERYIMTCLQSEGKGGNTTKISDNTFVYEKDVFDSNEMLPWIRTFTGRIIDFECSSKRLEERFKDDLNYLYKMYDLEDI